MRFHRTGTRSLFLFTIAAAALLVAPALAQPGPMGRGGHGPHEPGMGLDRMIRHLDLTEEQRQQLEQLQARHRDATRAVRDQLRAAHERFAELAHAETLDEAALREAAAEMAELRSEMMLSRVSMRREVDAILTPEQLEQLQQMRQGRRHGPGGRGPGRGGQGPHGFGDCPRFDDDPEPAEE